MRNANYWLRVILSNFKAFRYMEIKFVKILRGSFV